MNFRDAKLAKTLAHARVGYPSHALARYPRVLNGATNRNGAIRFANG